MIWMGRCLLNKYSKMLKENLEDGIQYLINNSFNFTACLTVFMKNWKRFFASCDITWYSCWARFECLWCVLWISRLESQYPKAGHKKLKAHPPLQLGYQPEIQMHQITPRLWLGSVWFDDTDSSHDLRLLAWVVAGWSWSFSASVVIMLFQTLPRWVLAPKVLLAGWGVGSISSNCCFILWG